MSGLILAALIGVVAGLRAMTAPAALAWAAYLGWLDLAATPLAFLGHVAAVAILTILALGEFVTDQLPTTPSRTVPLSFGTRIAVGAFCGAALLLPTGWWPAGLIAGAVGAVVGTLGGAALRARLAKAFGSDRPAALLEDAVAVLAALLVVGAAS